MRAVSLLLVLSVVPACTATGPCASDADCDTDVDTDTGATDTDGDTDVAARVAPIAVEWEVDALPNDNVVTVTCDGRELLRESIFTVMTSVHRDLVAGIGAECTVKFKDERGGRLMGGRAINCSQEVATWEPTRGKKSLVATFTVFACAPGCVDPIATNYNPAANLDDGTCDYVFGCTDTRASNYNALATKNDGSCDFGGFTSLDLTVAFDDRPIDTVVNILCDGSRALQIKGATRDAWLTASARTVIDAGHQCDVVVTDHTGDQGASGVIKMCDETVQVWSAPPRQGTPYDVTVASFFSVACSGCTDPVATNYDSTSKIDDGTCTY